jgi:hypothetical protein
VEFGLIDYSWRLVKFSCDLILKLDLFVLEISNCELNKDLLNWKFRGVTLWYQSLGLRFCRLIRPSGGIVG